jgi:two-component system, sensor histidine kinase and response regulator
MRPIPQRSVRATINLISAIGVVVFITYFAFNLVNSLDSDERLNSLEKQQLPMLMSINNASLNILQVNEYLSSAFISSDEGTIDQAEQHSQVVIDELKKLAQADEAFAKTAANLLIKHQQFWLNSKKLAYGMINNTLAYDDLLLLSKQKNSDYEQVKNSIADLEKEVLQTFAHNLTQVRKSNEYGLWFGLLIGAIFLIFTVIASKWTLSRLSIPLKKLTEHADAIAHGQLEHNVDISSEDEFGQLSLAFNKMSVNLQQLVVDLEKSRDNALAAFQSKSEFLASMSHEIRTPMNGVLGMLGLLNRSELTQEQHHRVKLATSSAESLLTLINDILDFSKVEAGKLDIEILEFDLRTMLGDFAETMALKAQEKNLELIVDVSNIDHSVVLGDPGRIRQILTNLVSNAIKFTSHGEIVITAAVESHCDSQLQLSCSVTDTGIGIPTNKLASIFDSFTQVDASTTRHFGGTGLGLAICKQLCQLMQGDVNVSSNEGHGSCFSFTLLLGQSERSIAVSPTVNIENIKLLVVDDNKTNRLALKTQFELWGAKVVDAENASDALTILSKPQHSDIKVAFLDRQMPTTDGAELAKQIRNIPTLAKLKLVMMTSISGRGDAQYFAELGFDAYFPKPATTSDLFDSLAITLSDSPLLSSAALSLNHHTNYEKSNDEKNSHEEQLQYCRLLLVEDNRINQEVARHILAEFGINIDIAANGLEALASLKTAKNEVPYDIILMDCQMPEMDGYQATQEIRKGVAGLVYLNIPIIAMTANAMKGDKEKCLDAGMSDYLTKPINKDKLQEKLLLWYCPDHDEHLINEQQAQEKSKANDNTKKSHKDEHYLAEQKTAGENLTALVDTNTIAIWDKQAFLVRVSQNQNLVDQLVGLFFLEIPEQIKKLERAVQQQDKPLILTILHTIRGVAANIDALEFVEQIKVVESALKENTFDKSQYELLLHCYQNLITELKKVAVAH